MRALVLVFGLLGVAGAGFIGLTAIMATRSLEKLVADTSTEALVAHTNNRLVASVTAVVLGLAATVLVVSRRTKIAAVAFLIAYAAPVAALAIPPQFYSTSILLWTLAIHGGLAVAGVLSLYLKPKPIQEQT